MRKKTLCKALSLCLTAVLLLGIIPVGAAGAAGGTIAGRPDNPARVPKELAIDWNSRLTYEEIEESLANMAKRYPRFTELYEIGRSWQERSLWCLEITNERVPKDQKTGIGVFGNIHGGEREGGMAALYTAWWFLTNSGDPYVQDILDNYIIYVNPVINPDGYEQSWVINTRQNLRPRDVNGNGIPFSDPYTDIDGDGYIATIYRGTAKDTPSTDLPMFGTESPDWDNNGILGDDPRNSGIDLNRTFDYQWNRYDIDTRDTKVIGGNSWSRGGSAPASEPEIQAVQNFLCNTPMDALCTLHTGVQCVLVPWCYRAYDSNNPADADIPFMVETAGKMADALHETTGRDFFHGTSYDDIPTSGEMIDYAFGRLNIHAYTIEIYLPGNTSNRTSTNWGNKMPEDVWVFYSRDEIKSKLNLDPDAITDSEGNHLGINEGLWFYTSSNAQMVDKVPEEQDVMVKGARDAILTMIESEPYGDGYQRPAYIK